MVSRLVTLIDRRATEKEKAVAKALEKARKAKDCRSNVTKAKEKEKAKTSLIQRTL